MKHLRIIVTHYGGPEALQVLEEECPEPQDGEVRVRVLAAGVALPDVMAREGVRPATPPFPSHRAADPRSGRVVGYGNTSSLRGEGLVSGRPGRRNRLHGIPIHVVYIAGGPGRPA